MQAWMEGVTMDDLPDTHRRIAEVIGVEATLKLCETYGGMPIYVPKLDSVYAQVRDAMIRREYNGVNVAKLARQYGLTTRTVQTIVQGMPPPQIEGQMTLDDIL